MNLHTIHVKIKFNNQKAGNHITDLKLLDERLLLDMTISFRATSYVYRYQGSTVSLQIIDRITDIKNVLFLADNECFSQKFSSDCDVEESGFWLSTCRIETKWKACFSLQDRWLESTPPAN